MKTPTEWFHFMSDTEKDEMFQWVVEGLRGTHRDFVESLWDRWTASGALSEKQIHALKTYHDNKGKGKFY